MSARPRLAELMGLEAHPEGGWYARTWTAAPTLTPPGYPDARPSATAIHYVLGAGESSAWHRVRSDELWLFHRGAALSLSLGGDGPAPSDTPTDVVLGGRVESGELPQVLVPARHWQRARPLPRPEDADGPDGGAVLVSCVVSPGFDFADFELA